jgi:hypothetical protein
VLVHKNASIRRALRRPVPAKQALRPLLLHRRVD